MDSTDIAEGLKAAPEQVLVEIIRLAEARMEAQLTAAIAADQRAMTFLGFVLTLVAFFIGAALAAITASTPSQAIANIAAAGAVGLMISGALAFMATRPISFEFVGNDPESWLGDVKKGKPFTTSLAEQAGHYNEKLETNRVAMKASARFLSWASAIAGLTVLVCAGFAAPIVWG